MELTVRAPLAGTVIALGEVPDPVFAGALVGPGAAIDPDAAATVVHAPVAGTLVKLKPHAFVVSADDGRAVLVHLGIDTVKRGGDGFEVLAAEGDRVRAGDPIIKWDPVAIRAAGLSAVCPVVALDAASVAAVAAGPVRPGDAIFSWS